ncbi:ABC transporter permease [Rhodococcus triatomae]|uniref:Transport permease protein n=1 Tax=Rhodococcus triatomae TaxID=300028 RepID=A0A1G8CEW8_9NOCA|nr:ABC transporter permease [Rhodococcus triatomae]QNG18670.1 ABC transporter permease [Rhodococcus triatomae]QNG21660.1 ABC transporter permease [Rhodococcus triatomae]SDH43908.1 ABC-2 type transport system permease protein [Rhodococcus triatomae]
MNPRILVATTGRILAQLRSDHRTVAMILLVPTLLMVLLYFLYQDVPTAPGEPSLYSRIAVTMLGVLPFVVMFLVTSIAMQRERSSGTLERLLTTPLAKFDLLGGYAAAFSAAAIAQAALACAAAFGFLGIETAGSVAWVVTIAVLNAILGVALGLLCSAFARTEFQAVQFMPVVVIPQFLLCGLLVPRDQLPTWLEWVSNVLPLSYAVDALGQVTVHPGVTGLMLRDLAVVLGFVVVSLTLAAATLRRRTP